MTKKELQEQVKILKHNVSATELMLTISANF